MISYQALVNEIIAFYNAHLQVKKVGSDFKEQLFNFATKDEKYPIVYIVPVDAIPTENTNDFTLEIYCFDIIQKDRANINVILSDCHQILMDLYLNYTFNNNDRDFGIKLYQNNFSNDDLYTAFIGLTPGGALFPLSTLFRTKFHSN